MTSKNNRFINALLRKPVDCTPVWMMRQAGRYLPEYREVRKQAGDFLTLCKTPELACEVTLQPLRRYALDAAILFSDILTIPDAMGLGLYFKEGEGPCFERPISTMRDVEQLAIPDPEQELQYVPNAVRTIKHALDDELPLIGFSGSPWTLATYMIEGGSSKTFNKPKSLLYQDPPLMHKLLGKLAQSVTSYLNAQIAAGVDAVMIFDTWGGLLSTSTYDEFSLRYMQQIIEGLERNRGEQPIPVIVFTKGGSGWLEQIAQTGCDGVGLDWTIDIDKARQRIGDKVALQGNLDPAVLFASPERIEDEVKRILANYGHGSGHVFNLGHGIDKAVAPERVSVFIDAVHKYSKQYHE
ncbi:MAG: uroporphyrinogen decarboxylase [Legionellales bacterium]|nr:uroporphyrinogen decarboxylase [Legionellales bacterium]|tara:strand:+ start:25185 stop:26246 length:1062 start_codon:yes stop_codon:yes gene_type:complete